MKKCWIPNYNWKLNIYFQVKEIFCFLILTIKLSCKYILLWDFSLFHLWMWCCYFVIKRICLSASSGLHIPFKCKINHYFIYNRMNDVNKKIHILFITFNVNYFATIQCYYFFFYYLYWLVFMIYYFLVVNLIFLSSFSSYFPFFAFLSTRTFLTSTLLVWFSLIWCPPLFCFPYFVQLFF